jgi:MFS family permease
MLTAAVSAWLMVLSWGGVEMPWTAPPILGLGAVGAMLIAVLAWQECRFSDPLLPPRLFANPVFTRGVAIAFCGALALFGGSFLLPLFFQLVRGANAALSGALVVPFLASNCVGAWFSGHLARRHGKLKAILLSGLIACAVGFVLLAFIGAGTPRWVLVMFQLVLGFGLGMVMPASLVCVQNAAEKRDIGAATGCLLFLRSMGGAFGSTLVGAVLAGGFTRNLAVFGIHSHIDLGEVRQSGATLPGVPADMLPHVQQALAGAFHLAFLSCAVAMVIAVVVTLGMRDVPLRSTSAEEPHTEPEPAALAH